MNRGRRTKLLLPGLGLAVAICGVMILHFFPPETHVFYPRCALHTWTGLHCPGCGSLRALSALTHGEVRQALSSNLLLTLSIPAVGALMILRRWRHGDWSLGSSAPNWSWWLVLLLVLGFGLIRNLPGPPFDWLHP